MLRCMLTSPPLRRLRDLCQLALLTITLLFSTNQGEAATNASVFSNRRIDFGVVTQDSARMARFLTNGLGFVEVPGFDVPPDLGRKVGLIDGHAVKVRVFAADEREDSPRVKVLGFPELPVKKPDLQFIHHTSGVRYLTLFVPDIARAAERLSRAGIKMEGETPLDLGGGTHIAVVRDPDGNFWELLGPSSE